MTHVQNGHYLCPSDDPQNVLFRGRLYGTNDHTPSHYIGLLRQWISQGSRTIVVNSIRLTLDKSCTIYINSFSDPECSTAVSTSSNVIGIIATPTGGAGPGLSGRVDLWITIGGGVVGMVSAVLCCTIVLVCCLVCCWKRSKERER